MTERRNIVGYNVSWTQPYLPTSYNPFYETTPKPTGEELMARIEMVDKWIDSMLTYPDAEAIINKLRHKGE